MTPNQKQNSCFLEEQGVTITSTSLITPGHSIAFAKLSFVRIWRSKPALAMLSGTKPSFRLMVADAPNKVPFVVFETRDADLIKRIEAAMDQAAAVAKGERVL